MLYVIANFLYKTASDTYNTVEVQAFYLHISNFEIYNMQQSSAYGSNVNFVEDKMKNDVVKEAVIAKGRSATVSRSFALILLSDSLGSYEKVLDHPTYKLCFTRVSKFLSCLYATQVILEGSALVSVYTARAGEFDTYWRESSQVHTNPF